MAVVELLLPALPEHVRTARLVVVAAARRAGLEDELVDELRLAVGEACARAVGMTARHAPGRRVRVSVTDDVLGLTVAVQDAGPAAGPAPRDLADELLEGSPDPEDRPGGRRGSARLARTDPESTDPYSTDPASTDPASTDPASTDPDSTDPDVSLGLLAGLVDEVDVSSTAAGTTVTMRWPLPRRLPGGPGATAVATA